MDWNYIFGDAEFYAVSVAELLVYVLAVAGVAMLIERIVDRIRGRRPDAPAQASQQRAPERRPAH